VTAEKVESAHADKTKGWSGNEITAISFEYPEQRSGQKGKIEISYMNRRLLREMFFFGVGGVFV